MSCEDRTDSVYLYALNALERPERDELLRHLETGCPACLGALAEVQATVSQLPAVLHPEAAPARIRNRLLERARAGVATPQPVPIRRSTTADWARSLTAAALAASIAYLAATLTLRREAEGLRSRVIGLQSQLTGLQAAQDSQTKVLNVMQNGGVQIVQLSGTDDAPQARAELFWDQGRDLWALSTTGMKPLANNRVYELWYIDTKPNPAGTFTVDKNGKGTVVFKLPSNRSGPIAVAAITEELAYAEKPTMPILLKGSVQN